MLICLGSFSHLPILVAIGRTPAKCASGLLVSDPRSHKSASHWQQFFAFRRHLPDFQFLYMIIQIFMHLVSWELFKHSFPDRNFPSKSWQSASSLDLSVQFKTFLGTVPLQSAHYSTPTSSHKRI